MFLGAGDEVAAAQSSQGRLHHPLGQPRAIRDVRQAQTDSSVASRPALRRQKEIDQEGRRRTVMTDQIAQQHVDDISIHTKGGGHAMASDAIATASILEVAGAVSYGQHPATEAGT